jgi:hypothetical protein
MPKPTQPRYGDFAFIICVKVSGVFVEDGVSGEWCVSAVNYASSETLTSLSLYFTAMY